MIMSMTKSQKKSAKKSIKKTKSPNLKITSYSHANDTMQIIYGAKDAVSKGVEFMKNVEKKWICAMMVVLLPLC